LTSSGSPLARDGVVRFESCGREPFVSLQQGTSLHALIVAKAAALGMRLDIRVQVSGYAAIALLVSCGAGVGIVPKSAVEADEYPNLRIVELSDPWAKQDLQVCRRRERTAQHHFPEKLTEFLCGQPALSTRRLQLV